MPKTNSEQDWREKNGRYTNLRKHAIFKIEKSLTSTDNFFPKSNFCIFSDPWSFINEITDAPHNFQAMRNRPSRLQSRQGQQCLSLPTMAARFFLTQYTKTRENVPKLPLSYQMAIKYMYQMAIKYSL
jgi:hypothetical protein